RQLLDRADDPAHRHDLAVAPALELGQRAVRLPPQLLAHAVQRMLGDVEPERLLLHPQQLGLVRRPRRHGRTVLRPPRARPLPATTAKSSCDSFTSGGSTSIPISSQALT